MMTVEIIIFVIIILLIMIGIELFNELREEQNDLYKEWEKQDNGME